MALMFRKYDVRNVTLGGRTSLADGVLTIDRAALGAALRERDDRIEYVEIHLVRPGDAARILCTKDVIQPRYKVDRTQLGTGTTVVLENIAVVTCGPIVAFQEGIIDMSGPGANYTPFSELTLVVVEIEVVEGTNAHQHEAAVRSAGLHVAEFLAASAAELAADRTDEILWNENSIGSGLPRVAYVNMVLSQGLLHDTYVLGRNAIEGLPCFVDPRVVIDGGIVSGNCVAL